MGKTVAKTVVFVACLMLLVSCATSGMTESVD